MTGDRGRKVAAPPETPEIAVSLARAGWPVFPVTIYEDESGKRSKVPAVKWKEWATTDEKTVAAAWAGEHSGRWIGVYAGAARIVVLDVDPGGDVSLAAAGLTIPSTFNYPTHRPGGRHYVYAAPAGVELTIARGLKHNGAELEGIDVRSGAGLMVYYGPALEVAPELAPAPDWLLVTREATGRTVDHAPHADLSGFFDRCVPGKPDKAVRAVLARVTPTNMRRDDMLAAVTDLVKLGAKGHRGVTAALTTAREVYSEGWADAGRQWDNAVTGSVKRLGLPSRTLAISKAERKAIKLRNAPEAIEQAKTERKAARVGELTKGDDIELAGRVADDLRPDLAYVSGAWRASNGVIYEEVSEANVIERVRLDLEERGVDAYRHGDHELAKYLKRGNTVTQIARLIRGPLELAENAFDADPDVLNAPNGVVDLRTGEIRERRPDDYFTRVTRATYKPGAQHPDVDAMLTALQKSVRVYLQDRLGQAITGHMPDDDIVSFFIGLGSNGKSLILGTVLRACGSYAAIMPAQLLEANPGDHPVALMELHGRRIAVQEELRDGHTLPMKRIKDIAGTSPMKARRLYGQFVEWFPTHALFVSSNYQPRVAETDHGTWRRLEEIPFPYRFVASPTAPDERLADPRLRSKLAAGRGGRDEAVLAWLVAGALRWYANGSVMPAAPKAVAAATRDWRETSDVLFAFASDCLTFGSSEHVGTSGLLERLNEWLRARGEKVWTDVSLSAEIAKHELFRQHNVEKARKRLEGLRVSLWLGVGLRPNEDVLTSFARPSTNTIER